jgi:hypothetical protein
MNTKPTRLPSTTAVLPFSARMQRAAPEALTVKIQSLKVSRTRCREATVCDVHAIAQIVGVTRSATGIQSGKKIVIHYQAREMPVAAPGMAEVPVLKAGATIPVFLERNKDGQSYATAARSRSFSNLNRGSPRASGELNLGFNVALVLHTETTSTPPNA